MATAVSALTATIRDTRNILRKIGITDMDSMMHCVLFTAARMLTPETLDRLHLSADLSWASLMQKVNAKQRDSAEKHFLAILESLDREFGTKEFPYSITSYDEFAQIIRAFDSVDIFEVMKHTDVLGYIYENHITTGAGKSGGRDLGKFYTDRSMTRYLVELLEALGAALPGGSWELHGRPETMCDATMGTGGFLLSYADNVQKRMGAGGCSWEADDLAGGDIDTRVAAIARLNLFLKTGKVFPLVRSRNTLRDDIAAKSERRTFRRVLMNIPFGVKGLKLSEDCCERVKEIVKVGTKSEPLFLALACQLVADMGLAAVIVPDSVLVNVSKQHDAMRKYLLDTFELKRVIKMRGKFFMNTNIEPSVLVFARTGKPTTSVEFWSVEKMDSGEMAETHLRSLKREELDASSCLDVRRYLAGSAGAGAVAGAAPAAAVPTMQLGSILTTAKGQLITLKDAVPGPVPLYSASPEIRSHSVPSFDATPSIIQACVGSIETGIHYSTTPFAATANLWVLRLRDEIRAAGTVNLKYIYYILKLTKCFAAYINHSVIPKLTKSDFDCVEIPMPPRPLQDQIVERLDAAVAATSTESRALAAKLREQLRSYVKSVSDVAATASAAVPLGPHLAEFRTGKNNADLKPGPYPFYMSNGISQHADTYQFEGEYILTARCGSLNGTQYHVNGRFSASDFTYVVKPKETILPRFLYHIFATTDWTQWQSGTTLKGIRREVITDLLIPLPPLEEQRVLAAQWDMLDAAASHLESLVAQSDAMSRRLLQELLPVPAAAAAV